MVRSVRDERGVVLPTRLLALCISAVAVAALVFIANDPDEAPRRPGHAGHHPPERVRHRRPRRPPRSRPPRQAEAEADQARQELVEVFNNTRIKGLAGGIAAKAKAAGWNVVGSDNWYGTVDGTTVYYPPRLEGRRQGARQRPRHQARSGRPRSRCSFDRLTVILTDDYR